jgi:hypothetical protein
MTDEEFNSKVVSEVFPGYPYDGERLWIVIWDVFYPPWKQRYRLLFRDYAFDWLFYVQMSEEERVDWVKRLREELEKQHGHS